MTQEQKEFILRNHGKMTRQTMAKKLHVNINYLTNWAVELTGERRIRKKITPPKQKPGYFYHDEKLATI